MLGSAVSVMGALVIAVGTFIRVCPDLDRWVRRHFYKNYPLTRELFKIRGRVKKADSGTRFTIYHDRAIKEFIDYVDANDMKEPPEELPHSIKSSAAHIEAEYEDGTTEDFLRGGLPNPRMVEILTLSIERRCRNWGLFTALLGTGLVVLGTIL